MGGSVTLGACEALHVGQVWGIRCIKGNRERNVGKPGEGRNEVWFENPPNWELTYSTGIHSRVMSVTLFTHAFVSCEWNCAVEKDCVCVYVCVCLFHPGSHTGLKKAILLPLSSL